MKYKLFVSLCVGVLTLLIPMLPLLSLSPSATASPEVPPREASPSSSPEEESVPEFVFENEFRILDSSTSEVLRVGALDYIRGAIAAEAPISLAPDALAAMGVAAYTNAVRCQLEQERLPSPELNGAHFSADPSALSGWIDEDQARVLYGGSFDAAWEKLCDAAQLAAGWIMLYDGEPIVAAYSEMSCGRTESAGNVWGVRIPYLVPVDSPGDPLAPGFLSTAIFTQDELSEAILQSRPGADTSGDSGSWVGDIVRSSSGYVLSVELCGETFSGQELRRMLSLRSSCFEISFADGIFLFSVKGHGHGAGLSQYGADSMARQGADFLAILRHYYPGAAPVRVVVQ